MNEYTAKDFKRDNLAGVRVAVTIFLGFAAQSDG